MAPSHPATVDDSGKAVKSKSVRKRGYVLACEAQSRHRVMTPCMGRWEVVRLIGTDLSGACFCCFHGGLGPLDGGGPTNNALEAMPGPGETTPTPMPNAPTDAALQCLRALGLVSVA